MCVYCVYQTYNINGNLRNFSCVHYNEKAKNSAQMTYNNVYVDSVWIVYEKMC